MSAKLIHVIDLDERRGDGTEDNPHRIVRQFWTTEGLFVMERDTWAEERTAAYYRNVFAAVETLKKELDEYEHPRLDIIRKAQMVISAMLRGVKTVERL